MAKAAADYGATAIFISNHTEFDSAYFKAQRGRRSQEWREANPFDVGADGVARYFAVVDACAAAARNPGDR